MLEPSVPRHSPPLIASASFRVLPSASRHVLRGGPQVMKVAGEALDLNISDAVCRSTANGSRAALWLGPDEQLLLTSVEDGAAVARRLREALAGLPHSLVDVSHRQLALEVEGLAAETLLNAGCPLDLDPASFPVGMCTRTLLGKADIVLWRTAALKFHLEVWRSFADYASRFLAEAARELAG